MRPSNNLQNKTLSDTYWRVQLALMKVQAHSSLELPLEYNQDQTSLMNQGSLWHFNHLGSYGNIVQFHISSRRENRMPESSRDTRFIKILTQYFTNNFALSDADDNTSSPLNGGGIADLPLLTTLLAIRQKSWEPSFWELMDPFVLAGYTSWQLQENFCIDY